MARHLIIGTTATSAISSGVEVAGAINVQKMSSSGPADLVLGDTIIDAPQIRFMQGTSAQNIVTPWIYGRDIINYSGKSYTAPVACQATDTIAGTSANAGTLVLKFVYTNGPRPEFWSFSTAVPASEAHTTTDATIKTAFEDASLVKPDWLNPVCDATAGATVVFDGAQRGDTTYRGTTWDYESAFIKLIVESYDGGTQTHTASHTTNPTTGYGDYYAVKAMEEELMGTQYGYYNRLELPKAPTTTATNINFDMYNITATKDGSSNSQIHGVDNLIEINLATLQGDADSLILENKINGYLAGAFQAVQL